jgi:hypothetical protein
MCEDRERRGRQKAVGKMPPAIYLQQCASKGNRNESQILIGASEVPFAAQGLRSLSFDLRQGLSELQRANAQKPRTERQSKLKAPGRNYELATALPEKWQDATALAARSLTFSAI